MKLLHPTPHSPRTGLSAGVTLLLVFVVVLLMGGGCAVSGYNGLVTEKTAVEAAWEKIDNQYKRRAELIPQLVKVVKGSAKFEKETIENVTRARAQVGQIKLPDNLLDDPAKMQAYMKAQSGLGSALARLLAVSERYPELKSIGGFSDLQSQIEGTENRIAVARTDYIATTQRYNTRIRKFPTNLMAGMFNFEEAPKIDFDPGDRVVPDIDLDFGDE